MNWLIAHEPTIRLACFLSLICIMLIWESIHPARVPRQHLSPDFPNLKRRFHNILLSAINTLVIRLLPALSAVAIAHHANQEGWGLFNMFSIPWWLSCAASVVILDMCIYFQHRIFHALPWCWKLHRVHHSDEHIDTTTAIRFHPIEIVLSMMIKVVLVILLGAPAAAVILFEVILNGGALFNHGNVRLPQLIDKHLRKLIVTPDMHRVHHSTIDKEMNSNFGFSLSIWDRLFGTYHAQPELGHEKMKIGLPVLRGKPTQTLNQLLLQPWRKNAES